jgi:hypothetical protein
MSFPSHWHWQSLIQYAVPHCSGRHYTTMRGAVQLKSLVSAISVEFTRCCMLQGIQHLALISGLRVRRPWHRGQSFYLQHTLKLF